MNCSTEPSVTRFIVPWYVEPSFGIEGAVEVGLDAGIDVGADGTDVGAGGVGGGGNSTWALINATMIGTNTAVNAVPIPANSKLRRLLFPVPSSTTVVSK